MEETKTANIPCSKYIYFDTTYGTFGMVSEASEMMYRYKGIICSYSGCDEWANHFVLEMMNLYSGDSPYNYALGSCDYHTQFPELFKDHKEELIEWVRTNVVKERYKCMFDMIDKIIDNVPKL